MPHLLSFAKKTDISVHQVVNLEYLEDLFHLSMSQQAFHEFQELESICLSVQTNQDSRKDEWSYIWGNNQFSAKKAYKVMMGYQ